LPGPGRRVHSAGGGEGVAMSEPIRLDDKDREVILRCRKAQEKLKASGAVQLPLMWGLFWLWVGGWAVAMLVFGGLLLVKGRGALPSGSGEVLVGVLLWIAFWYVLTKAQAFRADVVRVVCNLADAVEGQHQRDQDPDQQQEERQAGQQGLLHGRTPKGTA
jgi:hypothetical protein